MSADTINSIIDTLLKVYIVSVMYAVAAITTRVWYREFLRPVNH